MVCKKLNHTIKFALIACFLALVFSCKKKPQPTSSPNILLIVADDLGFGDLGCYGSEIETPNIDSLAINGIRFSNFNTAPMCSPTRAMLLSGNDNHIAGIGLQSRVTDSFGYEGHLSDRVEIIPEILKKSGYHSYMAGKWHLGHTYESNPHQRGFDCSFALLEGAANHYANKGALGKGNSSYTENGQACNWPEGAYSTDFYTDKLIEYIDRNKNNGKPFFAYAAYTSPHWPLQVDSIFWMKYKGYYDLGYEVLRESRIKSLARAGIIPKGAYMPEMHPTVKKWANLSRLEKRKEARKMELYAGMVDNLDWNIGRLIGYLKQNHLYDNTLIVFMSDNGAAHRSFIDSTQFDHLKGYYNDSFENMGDSTSYISYGSAWAEAGSAPFKYFKDYATQGGINTTLIISGTGVYRKGSIQHVHTTVQDLAPTFYELTGADYLTKKHEIPVYPLRGHSMLPFLKGITDSIHPPGYIFAMEHNGNAMLRKENWKITNTQKPLNPENFELYNIKNDIAEQINLKDSLPSTYKNLIEEWEKFSNEVRVLSPPPKRMKK